MRPEEEKKRCAVCENNVQHLKRAEISRAEYAKDRERNEINGSIKHFSMDMQKIIMLPHLPGLKTALFTRRILMVNQTIAPLGGQSKGGKPLAYLWHEGIQGRNDEDVASVLIKFLSTLKDCSDTVVWCDNCSGQNKNWTLFSAIAHFMAKPSCQLKTVTLKFFEKGHTFMSADSFHHMVEKSIKAKGKLYDFADFVDCVNEYGEAIEMAPSDFMQYRKELGSGKDVNTPKLRKLSLVQFQRRSQDLFFKREFSDSLKVTKFLKRDARKSFKPSMWKDYPSKEVPRGVNEEKKTQILSKLRPFMIHKIGFWENLPSSDTSADLTINLEHLPTAVDEDE